MTDFIPDPRDRLEVPICKAIEVKDYKQALKLVEKRLAKVSDFYLQALRCFVLCCHPIVSERTKGLAAILEVQKSSRVVQTAAELDLYDEAIKAIFPTRWMEESAAICQLRVKAVQASPTDEKFAVACFRACLKVDNLYCAQVIASVLERNFVSNHAYQFWAITTQALYSISPACPKDMSSIMSSIAFKKIKVLASSTIMAKGVPSLRSLQTPQELLLFHRLVASRGNHEDDLEMIENEALGPASNIAKGEWTFQIKRLQALELRRNHHELFKACHELLSASRSNHGSGTKFDARGSDWFVWKGFLLAVANLNSAEAMSIASNELEAHLDENSGLDKTYRRNASLATVAFRFVASPDVKQKKDEVYDKNHPASDASLRNMPRVLAIWLHLYRYGHTTSAFTDVRGYLERLNFEEMQVFIKELPRFLNHTIIPRAFEEWKLQKSKVSLMAEEIKDKLPPSPYICDWDEITSGITQSKLDYLIKSSVAEKDRALCLQTNRGTLLTCEWCSELCGTICISCLGKLSKDSLQAYGWAVEHNTHINKFLKPTDKHPADEWAIITAMCLMKAAGCKVWEFEAKKSRMPTLNTRQLLQATVILDFAHSHSKANPQISILLVRLYSFLGAGSLAMRAYNCLGVKQIQGDTLSHILFHRISSLHPHSVTDESNDSPKVLDPSAQLKRLQRLYIGFRDQVTSNAWRSFENESYDSIFQLMEVSERLSRSMALATSVIELRRICRITRPDVVLNRESYGYNLLAQNPVEVGYYDNSDYSSFPNYEISNSPSFELRTRIAPGPSQMRVAAFLLLEELWMFVSSVAESRTGQSVAKLRLKRLAATVVRVRNHACAAGALTEPERYLVEIGAVLSTIILHAIDLDMAEVAKKPDLIAGFCYTVRQNLDSLSSSIMNAFQEFYEDDWVPMFITTLHPLYSAHEAASLIIAGVDYLSNTKLWVSPGIADEIQRLKEEASSLKKLVVQKGVMVRSRVNNGQWLDRVLGHLKSDLSHRESPSTDPTPQNQEAAYNGDFYDRKGDLPFLPRKNKTDYPDGKEFPAFAYQGMGELLSEIIPEEFLEHWAGEIIDSWRESTMGLACLKSD